MAWVPGFSVLVSSWREWVWLPRLTLRWPKGLQKEAGRLHRLPNKLKLGSGCILLNAYGVMALTGQGMDLEQTVYGQGHGISIPGRLKSVIPPAGNCH